MIRNGVIDARQEFAERRYLAEASRNFERIKDDALRVHGIDIEMCRATYVAAGERLFALVGDVLIDAYSTPPRIERWDEAKKRIAAGGPPGEPPRQHC